MTTDQAKMLTNYRYKRDDNVVEYIKNTCEAMERVYELCKENAMLENLDDMFLHHDEYHSSIDTYYRVIRGFQQPNMIQAAGEELSQYSQMFE